MVEIACLICHVPTYNEVSCKDLQLEFWDLKRAWCGGQVKLITSNNFMSFTPEIQRY